MELSILRPSEAKITVISPEVYTYGAMLVAGALEEAGFRAQLIKATPTTEISSIPQADVYAIGLYSLLHVMEFKNWISSLKRARKKPIIVGGPVTVVPEAALENVDCIDAVVVGEGEGTVVDLVDSLISRGDLESVDGIAFRSGGDIVATNPREPVDLDNRPYPKIPDDISYQSIRGAHVYMEVLRGCKGSCAFCQVPRFFGRKIRSRPLDKVVEEAKLFRRKGAIRIAISGGTTSFYGCGPSWVNEEEIRGLLRSLSEVVGSKNLSAPDIRADAATDGILEAIAKYTIGWIFFGIESGSQKMLDKMLKGLKVSDVLDAVYRARRLGVKPAGSFIVAYSGETDEDFQETLSLVRDLPLMDHFVSIAEPILGTPLAEEVAEMDLRENLLFVDDSSSFARLHGLSVAEMRAYRLMVEGYYARLLSTSLHDERAFKLFLNEVKKQGKDIKACTLEVKRIYSMHRRRSLKTSWSGATS
ncbi:MAG: methyl-coenzyme M reductase glutamine C-methyltransferase [Candidatus Nezhaarchaeota archaeon]|nr:methyl-coenzyme M reductase glutamine C-methyltransferase [Candidatus Nezhaarchaeota archaeon]